MDERNEASSSPGIAEVQENCKGNKNQHFGQHQEKKENCQQTIDRNSSAYRSVNGDRSKESQQVLFLFSLCLNYLFMRMLFSYRISECEFTL